MSDFADFIVAMLGTEPLSDAEREKQAVLGTDDAHRILVEAGIQEGGDRTAAWWAVAPDP